MVYASQQQLRKLQILLVDSDAHMREKVRQALSNTDILYCACSLDEAQHFLNESTPDILICEIELTNASGLELCRYVRLSPRLNHIPIMLLTTFSTLQDKIAGFDAGADDYVVKPFDTRHLLARIHLLSRIKRLEYDRN